MTVPPWPCFRRQKLEWLKVAPTPTPTAAAGAAKKKKTN